MDAPVLVVEDDPSIAELIERTLQSAGLGCQVVGDGEAALAWVSEHLPSLVVLDLMLPGVDGLEVTRRIRRHHDLPILMLTARRDEVDKLLGFEVGADDYVTKPFSPKELVARVRALLRRSGGGGADEVLVRGDLRIDPARRVVTRGETSIPVTSLEFDLLHHLARKPGRVYDRTALLDQVWGEGRVVDERSIDSLVRRLRKKLEPDPAHPVHVQTVWGAGYRFGDGT